MVAVPTRHRWFHPTPDRCLIVLLALEGFLLLSERLRWFPFNEEKGWTVLIAVAAVGSVLLLTLLWFAAGLLFRWRFQFRIRSLLVLVVAVAIACSWLAVEKEQARRQRETVKAIEKLGGAVLYDYNYHASPDFISRGKPSAPVWLRRPLGDDFFTNVTAVRGTGPRVTNVGLEDLKGLTQLEMLDLVDAPIADTGLERLKGLTQLRALDLSGTRVTDAGLEHLKRLTQLRLLILTGTDISDAGLAHLMGLSRLQGLYLDGARVTDAGLERLKRLTQLEELSLRGTQITDAGLERLKGLTQLEMLDVNGTRVTDAGMKKFLQALPSCYFHDP